MRDKYNYKNIKRWSKKIPGKNIFNLERVFVPINVENQHWVLGVIHIEKMIIELLDSSIGTEMSDEIKSYDFGLLQYVKDEYMTIYGSNMDTSKWNFDHVVQGFLDRKMVSFGDIYKSHTKQSLLTHAF